MIVLRFLFVGREVCVLLVFVVLFVVVVCKVVGYIEYLVGGVGEFDLVVKVGECIGFGGFGCFRVVEFDGYFVLLLKCFENMMGFVVVFWCFIIVCVIV